MSTARGAAIQQTLHSSPTLFTGLEIRTRKITFVTLDSNIKPLTAMFKFGYARSVSVRR